MLFAEVIVRERTDVQALTYAVPARIIPYIRVGAVVTVPLRKKEVSGVVVQLTKRVSSELRSKIKDILDIERQLIGFGSLQVQVIEKLANYYGASLAEVAYHALAFPSLIDTKSVPITPKKPLFLQAPWLDRRQFYLDIVKKYQEKRRLIFLFPVEQYAADFLTQLSSGSAVSDNVRVAEKRRLNAALTNNQLVILVGSQKWAFFPLRPNDVLVIDQPDHVGGTQQKRPYMSLKQIGLTRGKIEGIQVILGADLASLSDYRLKTEQAWRFIEKKLPERDILIFDRRRSSTLLLPNFEEELLSASSSNQKLLIFAASKNWANALYCRECGDLVKCRRCGASITLQGEHQFFCRHCGLTGSIPTLCLKRHNTLIRLGEGIGQIKSRLNQLLPKQVIEEISSNTNQKPTKNVIIATEKILSFPTAVFEAVFIASADQLLSGTDPDDVWHLLSILFQLRSRALRLVIQTHFPDHWVWSALGSGQTAMWYEQELERRKTYQLPPFGQELTVFGRDPTRQRLGAQATEITEKIEKNLPQVTISSPRTEKVNPREFQVTLELYSQRHLTRDQKKLLRSILPFSWFLSIHD